MHEEWKSKADHLTEVMRNSTEYKNYREKLSALKQLPELYEQVNQYRKKNLEMHSLSTQQWIDAGAMYYEQYGSLLNQPVVREFLASEDSFCRLIGQVKNYLYKGLHMDLDFLE